MSERGPGDERGRLGRQPGDSGRGDADPGVSGDSGYREQRNPESERAEYERGRADASSEAMRHRDDRGYQGQPGSQTQQKSGTGWGIAALVISILALLASIFSIFNLILAIPGIILGIVARRKGSRGLGLTAIIISVLAILLGILLTVLVGAALLNSPEFQQLIQEAQQQQ